MLSYLHNFYGQSFQCCLVVLLTASQFSCSEKPAIQSYSIPSEYKGPVVTWKLPSNWGENPDLSGPMAGCFHVKTDSGPKGRIGVMPFRQQVSTLDVANMFGQELGFSTFTEKTLSPYLEQKKIGLRNFEWLILKEKNSASLSSPKVALLALLRQEGETWLFPFIADQNLVLKESDNFTAFLQSCTLRSSKEQPIVAKSSRPTIPKKTAPPPPRKNPWTWQVPSNWKKTKGSSIRLASFSVSAQNGKKLDISVTSFPGDVGGLLANVNRWVGQIGLAPIDQSSLEKYTTPITLAGEPAHLIEAYGQEQGLLAGALFLKKEAWFFKLQGDQVLAKKEKENFTAFLQSIALKQKQP